MNEIVVGVDGSDTAKKAAATAARIATDSGDPLHLVMCVPRSSRNISAPGEQWHVDSLSAAEQYLKSLQLGLDVPAVTSSVSFDDPADALCAEAERLGARMIVVGNRRVRGAARVLGSVAIDVVRHAPCDVLVANTAISGG
jgi:nucleotide-binding universal stress UspA family protein